MRLYGCSCAQCRISSLTGPVVLITLGVLFALDHTWGRFEFTQTWPVLLIVIGIVKLIARTASDAGHAIWSGSPRAETGEKPNAS